MDGKELFSRVVDSIQEMYMKIGDTYGSVSLYYPFQGDFESLKKDYYNASNEIGLETTIEQLPERVRIIVSEDSCKTISKLPVKSTMKDAVGLIKDNADIDTFRRIMTEKYPGCKIDKSTTIEFDWLMTFPEELDSDVYCITEEMGRVTFHRFSHEDYQSLLE